MINVSRRIDRILVVLLSVALGGMASMVALRIFHEWAFRTEFRGWLWMTAVHSCIVFLGFAVALPGVNIHRDILSAKNITKCIVIAVLAGLSAVFVIPFGFVLVISGQAFITSGVATLIYVIFTARTIPPALPSDCRPRP